MKRILLVSNQCPNKNGVGNPIMMRMQKALASNERILKVDFLARKESIVGRKEMSRRCDLE